MKGRLWSHVDFLKLWGAQALSLVGSQTTAIALPLIAIHYLGADSFRVGMLASASYLPFLAFGLPAGAWVDRLPRRRLRIFCDTARCLLLLLIPASYLAGILSFPLLFIVALLGRP